jgi:hypothetical protein
MKDLLRAFFHWQYSQFFIGGAFGAGVGMLAAEHHTAAYVFFVGAGLWALIYWQVSDYLLAKHKELRNSRQKFDKKPQQLKARLALKKACVDYWRANISGSLVLILLTVSCLIWTRSSEVEYELAQLGGFLIPANDPDPPGCAMPMPFRVGNGFLKIYLGQVMVGYSVFPHKIMTVNKAHPLILNRNKEGRIAVTMSIFDQDNKIVVGFDAGKFTVNPNTRYRMERPDHSTLVVWDNYNNEVLNMRYINSAAMIISGLLHYPGANPAGVYIPKTEKAEICLGDVGAIGYDIESK